METGTLGTFLGGKSSRANVTGKENTHRFVVGDHYDLRERRESHCVWQRLSQQIAREIVRKDTFKSGRPTFERLGRCEKQWFFQSLKGAKTWSKNKWCAESKNGAFSPQNPHVCSPSPRVQPSVSLNPERNKTRNVQTSVWSSHKIEKRDTYDKSLRHTEKSSQDSSACCPVCEGSPVVNT